MVLLYCLISSLYTKIFKIILVNTLLKLQDSHNTLKCCS
nr:MAG TPA: hypothetical protein [Caudoviricetes sp.]